MCLSLSRALENYLQQFRISKIMFKKYVYVEEKFLDKSSNFFTGALHTIVLGHL